jgi:thymidylate synthase
VVRYKNVEEAFIGELREVIDNGENIEVRNSKTREIRARLIEIDSIQQRCLVIPGRNNNIFATIAESMWVIAGRDDLEYLSAYLPRAKDFSDDGETWRGAYGPRLRDWNGVDQLEEILAILSKDPTSRRAVATLFDPNRDFAQSKDVPCNNWLHFLIRNGRLDLHVVARSTDIWWGFSGINAFEWSLLLELMSYWLNREAGSLTFFTSSLHLYERHIVRAESVLASTTSDRQSLYSSSRISSAQFSTPRAAFKDALAEWMRIEANLRVGADLGALDSRLSDPLLVAYSRMIDAYWSFKRGESTHVIQSKLEKLGDLDLRQAAIEFFGR